MARGHGKLVGTGARDEIWHGDMAAWGHGKLEGTGTRDEIWHGDTGARMARRARDLSDSIKSHIKAWQHITKDPEILSYVSGVKVELNSPPCMSHRDRKFSASEEQILNTEIQKLMKKEVLEIARPEKGQVISPIFLTPKPDGSYRMILNLKQFNEYVTYHHFKMETLHTITSLMERNCFMASLDIKDAYYSVEVASEHRKYF